MTTRKNRSAEKDRFRPGTTGDCEAQLWSFAGPAGITENAPPLHWIAAASLDEALRYMRQRHADFNITEARLVGMIPLLSGSPLD